MDPSSKGKASRQLFWIAFVQVLVLALLSLVLKPAEAQTDPRTGTLTCADVGVRG